jgi:hypothetical protein
MVKLLDRYSALRTDISILGPYIDSDPESYHDFILDYPNRDILGSDAIASHEMRLSMEYVDRVRGLGLPPNIETGILAGNACSFLYGGGINNSWPSACYS